jgi:hypothetical protein
MPNETVPLRLPETAITVVDFFEEKTMGFNTILWGALLLFMESAALSGVETQQFMQPA